MAKCGKILATPTEKVNLSDCPTSQSSMYGKQRSVSYLLWKFATRKIIFCVQSACTKELLSNCIFLRRVTPKLPLYALFAANIFAGFRIRAHQNLRKIQEKWKFVSHKYFHF